MKERNREKGVSRGVKKFALSAFLIGSFAAYALESRASTGQVAQNGGGPDPAPAAALATGAEAPAATAAPAGPPTATTAPADTTGSGAAPAAATDAPTAAPTTPPTTAPAASPTTPPAAAPAAGPSGYKDGTYTGPAVFVNWGDVQAQATIKGGKITDVQFLQYPQDRRTSARINSFAVPELQREAIQAQSANVNIITGATLTSEGFAQSLDAALAQAQG